MTTEALDFYAYWNGAQVADLWTTLALITGTDDYRSLLLCVALFGLICAAAGTAVRYRGGDLIVWIAAMVFIFSAAFVPRVNIAVRDVRSANVQVVQNIPLGIGWPASVISRASYWLTESFETAFGDVDAARYTRFGVAFPAARRHDHALRQAHHGRRQDVAHQLHGTLHRSRNSRELRQASGAPQRPRHQCTHIHQRLGQSGTSRVREQQGPDLHGGS